MSDFNFVSGSPDHDTHVFGDEFNLVLKSQNVNDSTVDRKHTHLSAVLHSPIDVSGKWEVGVSEFSMTDTKGVHDPSDLYVLMLFPQKSKTGYSKTESVFWEVSHAFKGRDLKYANYLHAYMMRLFDLNTLQHARFKGGHYDSMESLVSYLNGVYRDAYKNPTLSAMGGNAFKAPSLEFRNGKVHLHPGYNGSEDFVCYPYVGGLSDLLGLPDVATSRFADELEKWCNHEIETISGEDAKNIETHTGRENIGVLTLATAIEKMNSKLQIKNPWYRTIKLLDQHASSFGRQIQLRDGTPSYIDIKRSYFDYIDLEVRLDNKPFNLPYGTLMAMLHFRRKK